MSAAVSYVLHRMQQDGRLAYLIGPGSQTYELLTQEAAEAVGRDVAEFRREFDSTLNTESWPSKDDIQDRTGDAIEAPNNKIIRLEGEAKVLRILLGKCVDVIDTIPGDSDDECRRLLRLHDSCIEAMKVVL